MRDSQISQGLVKEHETELGFVHFVIHGRRAVDEQRERCVELGYRRALLIEEARHLLRNGSRKPLVEPPKQAIAARGDPLLLQRAPYRTLQGLRERRCALAQAPEPVLLRSSRTFRQQPGRRRIRGDLALPVPRSRGHGSPLAPLAGGASALGAQRAPLGDGERLVGGIALTGRRALRGGACAALQLKPQQPRAAVAALAMPSRQPLLAGN